MNVFRPQLPDMTTMQWCGCDVQQLPDEGLPVATDLAAEQIEPAEQLDQS